MYRFIFIVLGHLCLQAKSQQAHIEATTFLNMLNPQQKKQTQLAFDSSERYRFNYVPLDDRKGISINELNATQRKQVFTLLRSSLSETTVEKITGIMQLETVLKELENRSADDHYRDPGKYYLTIFGKPSEQGIWGWRFEGHHISFSFSAKQKSFISGTPSFLGSNPAIVQSGAQKNKEILKEETSAGFALLHSLTKEELSKAVISTAAPAEIITGNNRKAMIEQLEGVRYTEISTEAQVLFLRLLDVYLHRYKNEFAATMLKDIQAAGMENLRFVWAGHQQRGIGKPCYYRIQGPSIIIEYDNTQNNANHIHTVIRDLKNDFGGDQLLEHYKKSHHHH